MYTKYNAKNATITVDDNYITGVGEDMATGDKDEEFSSFEVGAQGDVVESIINNDLGTISITVQRTCPQKNFLLGLAKRTEPFPIWITDKVLKERYGGSQAKLKKYPEMGHKAQAEDMTFEFQVIDYTVEAID
jgi:hypothetical protein